MPRKLPFRLEDINTQDKYPNSYRDISDNDSSINQYSTGNSNEINSSLLESVTRSLDSFKNTEELDFLIPTYCEYNNMVNGVKKPLQEYNSKIKDMLLKLDKPSYKVGDYTASVTVRKQYSFIEDLLILKLKELERDGLDLSRFIKVKEYVDMDALEQAIYDKTLDARDFADCQVVKDTYTLLVKKKSGKNKEKENP